MHTLTYVSSATKRFSEAELVDLLEQARSRNRDAGVTGVMLYSGGNIIQALEGPEAAVAATYARIQADPRHAGLSVLLDEHSDERVFPDWTMGFRNLTGVDLSEVDGYSSLSDHPALGDLGRSRKPVHVLLQTFRRVMQ